MSEWVSSRIRGFNDIIFLSLRLLLPRAKQEEWVTTCKLLQIISYKNKSVVFLEIKSKGSSRISCMSTEEHEEQEIADRETLRKDEKMQLFLPPPNKMMIISCLCVVLVEFVTPKHHHQFLSLFQLLALSLSISLFSRAWDMCVYHHLMRKIETLTSLLMSIIYNYHSILPGWRVWRKKFQLFGQLSFSLLVSLSSILLLSFSLFL